MKKNKLIILFLLWVSSIPSYTQVVYPVQLNTTILPPHSIYLSDYSAPNLNMWLVNMKYLDFNEPSIEVSMRLTIEGNGVLLKTNPFTSANNSFTLLPGEIKQLAGEDLAVYLDINNLDVAGITKNKLLSNGRLPEGFYEFSIEIFHAETGELLSQKLSQSLWLSLTDPPVINNPICGSRVDVQLPMALNFQWQQANVMSPNTEGVEYQLTLLEILNNNIDPQSAISNGQILEIFKSDWQAENNYLYGLTETPLDEGKRYAFVVQAKELSGRDLFKNSGYSQICWFNYGYLTGGTIVQTFPEDEHGFTKLEQQFFKWDKPDNLIDGQKVRFELTIKEVKDGQTALLAFDNNPTWFTNTSEEVEVFDAWNYELTDKKYKKGHAYVWQVKAFTDDSEIASSDISMFYGPPIVDEFYIGKHRVEVASLSSRSLNDLSGEGWVTVYPDEKEYRIKVPFEHLVIDNVGGKPVLSVGELTGTLPQDLEISLDPEKDFEENQTGQFIASSFKISKQTNLMLYGLVKWQLPFAVDSDTIPYVTTKKDWVTFAEFEPIGRFHLPEAKRFPLLEPYGFHLVLTPNKETYIHVNLKEYILNLNGFVEVPSIVSGTNEDIVPKYYFEDAHQLFYIQSHVTSAFSVLSPSKHINVNIHPQSFLIDLSEKQSHSDYQNDWKGIHFNTYQIQFEEFNQAGKSIAFSQTTTFSPLPKDTATGYINENGLTLAASIHVSKNTHALFNTFPSRIHKVHLNYQRNSLNNAYLDGDLQVPFFSSTEYYTFRVPITMDGYLDGYLNESFEGKTISFNEGEQKVNIEILRAVFDNYNHLNCDISIEWPHFDIQIPFADHLYVWGNYNIGFDKVNGNLALQQQVVGNSSGYEITATHIGAGRQKNLYSVGFMSTINMGEDAAGPNGVPEINAYSIYKSPLIPENTPLYSSTHKEYNIDERNSIFAEDKNGQGVVIEESKLSQETDALLADLEDEFIEDRTPIRDTSNMLFSELIPQENSDTTSELSETSSITLDDIYQIIDIVIYISKDSAVITKATRLKEKLEELEQSEVAELYQELKENGFSIKKMLKLRADQLVDKITAFIHHKSKKFELLIKTKVDSLMNPVSDKIDLMIDKAITKIGETAFQALIKDDSLGKKAMIRDSIIQYTVVSVQKEIERSVRASVHQNITFKLTGFVQVTITDRVTDYLDVQLKQLAHHLIDLKFPKEQLSTMMDSAGVMIRAVGSDVWTTIKNTQGDDITSTIGNVFEDAYKGIQWDKIAIQVGKDIFKLTMQDQLKALGSRVADSLMNKFVGEKMKKVLNGSAVGFAKEAVSQNVKLDFNNLGAKIKEGDVKGIVKFDPSVIVVKTKVAEFTATLDFIKDDPLWGDCFKGMVKAKLKKPKTIHANAMYVNGKKKTYKYWFLQFQIESGLNVPLVPQAVHLDGIGGKVFSRMAYNREDNTYYPDSTNRFGAGLMLRCIDATTEGKMLQLEVTAEMQVFQEYFELEIRGGAGVGFKSNKPAPVNKAAIYGTGYINFSSKTGELVGAFDVVANVKPIICAQGGMGFYLGEEHWRIYVGEEPNPIELRLLCKNLLKFEAWFDLSKTKLDLGLRADIEAYARSPWFKVFGTKVRPYAGFEFYFLARVQMDFSPKVRLREAQLELEIFAGIGCEWEKKKKSGTWNLAAAYFHGLAHYKNTDKEAFIKGELEGKIEIIGIKIGAKLKLDKDLG